MILTKRGKWNKILVNETKHDVEAVSIARAMVFVINSTKSGKLNRTKVRILMGGSVQLQFF